MVCVWGSYETKPNSSFSSGPVWDKAGEKKSLNPGIVKHALIPALQETEPRRFLSSRSIYRASSRKAKLRQKGSWKTESR